MEFGTRAGAVVIAAALLFCALRFHKSSNPKGKKIGTAFAFVAGLATLAAVVGDWMGVLSDFWASVIVALMFIAFVVLVVDWAMDKRPDKPAFWAAYALPTLLVVGIVQIPAVGNQIGDGGKQVADQMSKVGDKPAGKSGK
ncbi:MULTISPECIES: hypothetical protein [unclassified Micromonospora]|uniref:hypothetical protein n=1 Tax=unclassified Micromonospora TaxID=2617518 RepID=UPI0033F29462